MSLWCQSHDVTIEQLKYWKRRLKSAADVQPPSLPRFIPLAPEPTMSPSPSASLVVRVGPVCIELAPGFDANLLREAVEALQGLPC